MTTRQSLSPLTFRLLVLATALFSMHALAEPKLLATIGNGQSGPSTLLEIDHLTGKTKRTIGPVGFIVNGMEFDPETGKLYASTSVRDPNFFGLIEINLSTGTGTPVGPDGWGVPYDRGGAGVANITIDASGQMFGWRNDRLIRINKTTGIATAEGVATVPPVGSEASNLGETSGLDFDNTDNLRLIQFTLNSPDEFQIYNVFHIDATTGFNTLVGTYESKTVRLHHGDFNPATGLYYGIEHQFVGAPTLEWIDISNLTVIGRVPLEDTIHVITFVDTGPDQFLCYPAKVQRGTPRFEARTIEVQDQFGVYSELKVKRPIMFCNSIDNNNGLSNDDSHLTCYQVKPPPETPTMGKTIVRTEDQFGELHLRVRAKPRVMCVPAESEVTVFE